jgi:hypothetical protein
LVQVNDALRLRRVMQRLENPCVAFFGVAGLRDRSDEIAIEQ